MRPHQPAPHPGRMIPTSSTISRLVVRVAGLVPVRTDISHAGTMEQQLGLSLGTVLVYLRTGLTARVVAEGWASAAPLAQRLAPAIPGRRVLPAGPSTASALIRMAGAPGVTMSFQPQRPDAGLGPALQLEVGPITWGICDATAYASLLRGWRRAARLLNDNPGDD
ncbi:MAG: hypothetical protein ABS81_08195 [Pseudonocardia sp. SCN 72-86]|nr:MAG: hypothetical protein ABS81_08195 [Pseudonocardia sp. SCN 72-86]